LIPFFSYPTLQHFVKAKAFFLCWLLLFSISLFSQKELVLEHVLLSNNQEIGPINAIQKDYLGYIWIGSESGLYRYDSKNVVAADKIYNTHFFTSLIFDIKEDEQHNLWIASYEGLFLIKPKDDHPVKIYPYLWNDTKRFDHPEALKIYTEKNTIWFGSYYGLESYNAITLQKKTYPIYELFSLASNRRSITNIVKDNENNFWFGTVNGLCKFNTKTGIAEKISLASDPLIVDNMENVITTISVATDSTILIGTWGAGIKIFNHKTNKIITKLFKQNINVGTENIVQCITQDQKKPSIFYIGTADNGLGIYNLQTNDLSFFSTNVSSTYSLNSKYVKSLYIDYQKILWIGTDVGLLMVDLSITNMQQTTISSFIPPSENTAIVSFLEDPLHHCFYMGTYSNTLLKYDVNSGKIKHYALGKTGAIWSMYLSKNNLFINCNEGNFIFNTETEKISKNSFLPNQHFYNVYHINDSIVWFTSFFKSPIIYNTKTETYQYVGERKKANETINNDISGVYVDESNQLWVSTYRHGLGIYNSTTDNIELKISRYNGLPIYDISSIQSDSLNNIWFNTMRMGLFRFNTITKELTNYRSFNGIQTNSIITIAKDTHQQFWLASSNGLIKFNPITTTSVLFTTNDGLMNNNLENGITLLKNNSIFINQNDGFAIYNPQEESSAVFNYPLYFNEFEVANQLRKINADSAIVLNYHEDSFSVDFALLHFSKPQFNTYSYRLVGYHQNWINIGNTTKIYLSKIPAGNYTLEIKAAGKSGQWSTQQLKLKLIVLIPFWKTWWFYALCMLLIIMLVMFVYKYRMAQINKLINVRNKIAGDLHDDVGSSLSSIKLYAGFISKKSSTDPYVSELFSKIESTTKESLENMSDIVWSINPKNDQLEHVVSKMKAFSDNTLSVLGVTLNYRFTSETIVISMEARRHLYLFYKEAINNIAKYAAAKNVVIELEKKKGQWLLLIKDDGVGFDAMKKLHGNGMNTMKERAEELNGTVSITSTVNRGTTIELVFKPT
jgi:ligand-binding sensor domain-containing protein